MEKWKRTFSLERCAQIAANWQALCMDGKVEEDNKDLEILEEMRDMALDLYHLKGRIMFAMSHFQSDHWCYRMLNEVLNGGGMLERHMEEEKMFDRVKYESDSGELVVDPGESIEKSYSEVGEMEIIDNRKE